jgi:hypothetical protein
LCLKGSKQPIDFATNAIALRAHHLKSHEIGIDQLKVVKPRLVPFGLDIAQLNQHRPPQPAEA